MGLTVAEFLRTLPAAVAPLEQVVSGGRISIVHPAGEIRITLTPAPPRRLGMLSIPVTLVDFDLGELDVAERRRFLRRFDACFQRGGG